MIGLHKTSDGKVLPIATMEDSHLINTVRLLFKRAANAKAVADMPSFVTGGKRNGKPYTEVAAECMEVGRNALYIMEALRRDSTRNVMLGIIGGFFPELGNTQKVNAGGYVALLNPPTEEDDEEIDPFFDPF